MAGGRYMGRRLPAGLSDHIGGDCPGLPLVITENGAASAGAPGPDGRVEDTGRTAFLHEDPSAVRDAIIRGIDGRGCFGWSLLGNVEWAEGHAKRFGPVRADCPIQRRTPRGSAGSYAAVIENNALTVPAPLAQ